MSLSHDEIARLSRMSIDELHVEVGRTVYADRLGKKVITGEHPLSYHVKTVTRGRQTRVLFDTRVPRPPGREKLGRITKSLLSRYRKKLYRKICVDWNYCKQEGRYDDEIKLAQAIVVMLGAVVTSLPITAVYGLAFILIKMGLDKFCKCPKPKKAK